MARSSKPRKRKRSRAQRKAAQAPASQPAADSSSSAPLAERVERMSLRLRAYRWGLLFIPVAIPPLVASGNNLIHRAAPGPAQDTALLIAALLVYALAAGSAACTVRQARRRGHGWPAALSRGALALSVCFVAVLMGTALGLSAADVAGR